MNITVSIIDAVSGHPAEGVEVSVVGQPAGELTGHLNGLTDPAGNFTYSSGAAQVSWSGQYILELNVDAYFASQGMMAGYKSVTIVVRVDSTRSNYRIGTFITPFAHATWSVR
ncbi:hydroxyisourate hydrolase [Actinomadura sp. 7K507]|uniref:hydroxyisourate hydrolase n=1 Tax=Actinomadura sp. 7K507 TaxID=2530365 RepID=UPI00104FFFC1|nr:hydroxyisourate hydrolase [Actinomadura sp. 7K507]TDC98380.1 hypothetical protein E1285_00140 [Actinomadura sp. 7K507]